MYLCMHHIFALLCILHILRRKNWVGAGRLGEESLRAQLVWHLSPCSLFGREARYLGSSSSRWHPKVHRLDMLGTRVWLNMPCQVAPNYGELAEYGPGLGSEKKELCEKC